MNIRYTVCGHEVPQVSSSSFKFQAEPHFPFSLMKSSVTIAKSSLEVSDHDRFTATVSGVSSVPPMARAVLLKTVEEHAFNGAFIHLPVIALSGS